MSTDQSDLDDLLVVIEDFADTTLTGSADVDLADAQSTPLLTLVHDLVEAEVSQSLAWTFEVVEAVSKRSASWGFVLASRYAAQFATKDVPGASADVFIAAGERQGDRLVVPAAPMAAGPLDSLVVLDKARGLVLVEGAVRTERQPPRTGLTGAQLTRVTATETYVDDDRADARAVWSVLLGATICGLGAALLGESVRYTQQREQFGAPIASFPGLRAVVGSAHAEVRRARTLLYSHALGDLAWPASDSLATAADAVVNCAIDAVQSLGGYGYIDEFPVAGMFRDAVSLSARATSALEAWRDSAQLAYDQKVR